MSHKTISLSPSDAALLLEGLELLLQQTAARFDREGTGSKKLLRIEDLAERVEAALSEEEDDAEERPRGFPVEDSCPGCGSRPGDGVTPTCYHPGGCGTVRAWRTA